jgi:hypothetical protein
MDTAARAGKSTIVSVTVLLLLAINFAALFSPPVHAEKPYPLSVESSSYVELPSSPFRIVAYPDTKVGLWYNSGKQFYGTNASGLFVWVGSEAYGPSSIPAGNPYKAYTLVSQEQSGNGTAATPWRVTTTVDVGNTGVRIRSTIEYANGNDVVSLTTSLDYSGSQPKAVSLFHAGDLYLEFPNNQPDYGYGTRRAATGGIGATTSTGDYAFLFEPASPTSASAYMEAHYGTIWNAIGSYGVKGTGFDNTFRTDYHDAAAGLQWNLTLAPGTCTLVQHRLRLERVDLRPLSPRIDAPNIENWGEATHLSRRDFVDTYGAGGTCPTNGECRLEPAAEQWYKRHFANSGEGGYCYGMSVMTTLFYRSIYAASQFDSDAAIPYDLTRPNTEFEKEIAIYQAYQYDSTIQQQINSVRTSRTPNEILADIESEIGGHNLDPYILGVFGEVKTFGLWFIEVWQRAGHALVPYAVEDKGNNVKWVRVYDSNSPGSVDRYVEFNTSNNTWRFYMGDNFRSAVGGEDYWGGDAGNHRDMTMVSMSAHTGQKPRLPYANHGSGASLSWLSSDAAGYGNLLVTDSDGRRLGFERGILHAEIPGGIPVIPIQVGPQPGMPAFYLPLGSYDVELTSAVNGPAMSEIEYYGGGYAFSVESIDMSRSTEDHLIMSTSDSQVHFETNDVSKEINLVYAYSRPSDSSVGRTLQIVGADVGTGNGLVAGLDRGQDRFSLHNPGNDTKTYDLLIDFSSANGSGMFTNRTLLLAGGATHQLVYDNVDRTDAVTLMIDNNNDGRTDETVTLDNQPRNLVHLPVVQR